MALPAFAAALGAAAQCCCGTGCATIDRYLLLAWPTAANIKHAAAAGELDRRAIRRTERRMDTVPFHRPCSAHYADSANRRVLLSSYVITFSAVEGREAMGARVFDDSIQHGTVTVLVFVIRGYVARTHVSVRFVHATPASFIARHASLQQQHVNKGDRRRPTPPSVRCCALVSHFESTSYFCLLCLVDCGQTWSASSTKREIHTVIATASEEDRAVATGNMRRKVEVWTSGSCDTHADRKRTQTDLQTDTLIAMLRSPTLPYRKRSN